MNIQQSSREDNAKFNFLGIIWGSKRSWRVHFQAFRELKVQNFGYAGFITNLLFLATRRLERMEIPGVLKKNSCGISMGLGF